MSKLIISLSLIVLTQSVSAAEIPYEAQSRCANDAAAFYKQEFDENAVGDKFMKQHSTYENNYSMKMKSCFILITTSGLGGSGKGEQLFDIYAHRELGIRLTDLKHEHPPMCKLSKDDEFGECDETKWQTFIRPYLYNE